MALAELLAVSSQAWKFVEGADVLRRRTRAMKVENVR